MVNLQQRIVLGSLVDAIERGEAWSPRRFSAELEEQIHDAGTQRGWLNRLTRALSPTDRPNFEAVARSCIEAARTDQICIDAGHLRAILRNAEEDEARHRTKDLKGGDPEDGYVPVRACDGPGEVADRVIVTRFGIEVENACIEGPLTLFGYKFTRPLIFRNCSFTDSIDLSQATLGLFSLEGARFEKRKAPRTGALSTSQRPFVIGRDNVQSDDPVGLYARGATFSGDVNLRRLVAQKIDVSGATVKGELSLSHADVQLPCFSSEHEKGQHEKELIAVDCSAAVLGSLKLAGSIEDGPPALLQGSLRIAGATIGSIELTYCKIFGRQKWIEVPGKKPSQELVEAFVTAPSIQGAGVKIGSDIYLGGSFDAPRAQDNSGDERHRECGERSSSFSLDAIFARIAGYFRTPRDTVERRSIIGRDRCEFDGPVDFSAAVIGGTLKLSPARYRCGLPDLKTAASANQAQNAARLRDAFLNPAVLSAEHVALRDCARAIMLKHAAIAKDLVVIADKWQQRPEILGETACRGVVVGADLHISKSDMIAQLPTESRMWRTALDLRNARVGANLIMFFNEYDDDKKKQINQSSGFIDLRDASTHLYRDNIKLLNANNTINAIRDAFGTLVYASLICLSLTFILPISEFVKLVFIILIMLFFKYALFQDRFTPKSDKTYWPQGLKFRLVNFTYAYFPVRDAAIDSQIPDSEIDPNERMALTNNARIKWLELQDDVYLNQKFQPQPWIQCAKVMRELGYDKEAHNILFYREKNSLRSNDVSSFEKLLRAFLVLTCGHGHKMTRLLTIGLVVFAVGFFYNTIAINANLVRPTNAEILVDDRYFDDGLVPPDYSSLSALTYTLKRMFPIPVFSGSVEWAPCNWRQIQNAIDMGHKGACVPRTCQASANLPVDYLIESERTRLLDRNLLPNGQESKCRVIEATIVASYDDETKPKYEADILSATRPDSQILLMKIVDIVDCLDRLRLLDSKLHFSAKVNRMFMSGGAYSLHFMLGVTGFVITLLVTTFLVGSLKRRE